MIPYSRRKLSDIIPYPRVNCLKTILFTAAHTYVAQIWQSPPPGRRHPASLEFLLLARVCPTPHHGGGVLPPHPRGGVLPYISH